MKRLRHPITSIREPFGKAGLIVACLALVAALGGTALAAKHLFTKAQEKQIAKIAKRYAGKPGPAGPQGPQGVPGAPGTNGTNGKDGTNGANGESVTIKAEGECTKFSNATGTGEACNGEKGVLHPGETLPPEATETGSFLIETAGKATAISFPLPLPAALDSSHVLWSNNSTTAGTFAQKCQGTKEAPKAEPGFLCVYAAQLFGPTTGAVQAIRNPNTFQAGAATAGAMLTSSATEGEFATGTWAVTAP